ncbi:MAG: hypothetical protein ACXADW_20585 [Candidatus Hodarchaeales archaeon]
MSKIEYTAGTCNIGEEEIKQRRRIGHIGLVLTLVSIIIYLGLVYSIGLDIMVGILIFLPAEMSAVGLLQARNKFCAAYGLTKQQNVSSSLGLTLKIEDISNQKKDRNKALKIVFQSTIIAIGISILTVILGIIVSQVV